MQANYDLIDGNPHYVQPRLVEIAEVRFAIGDRVRTRTFQGQQHFRANYLNREAVIRDFATNNYYLLSFGDEADICYWKAEDLELYPEVLGVSEKLLLKFCCREKPLHFEHTGTERLPKYG